MFESINARQGIKTVTGSGRSSPAPPFESINARQGIKTKESLSKIYEEEEV